MISFIKKIRGRMFPEIEDWKSSQDHLRNAHPNDLDFYHFLWFHPISYTILKIGTPCVFITLGTVFALRNAKYGLSLSLIIPIVGLIVCMFWLFKEIRKLGIHLETNLYDILMKD